MPSHWSELPADVLALLRRGCVIPAHPLALDAGPPARRAAPARLDALLPRCRRGRPGGGRAFDAVRDPRRRPLRAGARARRAHRARMDRAARCDDRRAGRPHRAGRRRGAGRARPRLPRRHAVAGGDEGRVDRRTDRALRGRGASHAAGGLLPAAGGRRHRTCRRRSGGASPPSTTSSRSRWRRSTATARSTWCAAWSPPAPRTA